MLPNDTLRLPHFAPVIRNKHNAPGMKFESFLAPAERWPARGFPNSDCEVPAISGAAIFVAKSKFEQVGRFDENIFFYYEDDDLSIRLRKQFGPILMISTAQLIHREGESSPATPETMKVRIYHGRRAKIYVARKHGIPYNIPVRILITGIQLLLSPLLS